METTAIPSIDLTTPARRDLRSFVTDQLRVVLEQCSVRFTVIGLMLIGAFVVTLLPGPVGVDPGWMFFVPVAICAIAGGLREGMLVATASAMLCALARALLGGGDAALLGSVFAARLALYGLIALLLGAFAEAHHSVQGSLKRMATRDPLTDVANVASFYEELASLERKTASFAVMVVDLDDLKVLNDRLGHPVGSAAIRLVANTLRRAVRASDYVARYGGDEFVVLLKEADRAGAQIVANRTRELLSGEPIPGAPEQRVTVSIGVALYGDDGRSSEELLQAADAAMYDEKRAHKTGRGAIHRAAGAPMA